MARAPSRDAIHDNVAERAAAIGKHKCVNDLLGAGSATTSSQWL